MLGRSSLSASSAGVFRVLGQRVAPSLAAGAVLASGFLGVQAVPAGAEESDSAQCGAIIAADQGQSRQINLVLDDSGTMFRDFAKKEALTRWSHAKYSLGVFAALMGPGDELRVFRLSDFAGRNPTRAPVLSLSGSNQPSTNVERIDSMKMIGGQTPFAAVTGAFDDLLTAGAEEKWLVVLTDGKFRVAGDGGREQDIEEAELRGRIEDLAENGTEQDIRIAYLALGQDIPTIASQPKRKIYGKQATDTDDLLGEVEEFANLIFGRDELPPSVFTSLSPPTADIDIDMDQMIVFSQGPDINIGPLQTSSGVTNPSTLVNVRWSENPHQVKRNEVPIESKPDRGLEGQVAYFSDVPKGSVGFDISNARPGVPTVFYRPQVRLGYELRDPQGTPVRGNAVEAGEYSVVYGFQDLNCNFVESKLLGDVQYLSTSIAVGDEVVAEDFKSGDVISFPEGKADIEIVASYLQGTIVPPGRFSKTFLKPALMSRMVAAEAKFKVTEMVDFQADAAAIPLEYTVIEDGVSRLPDADEWAALDPSTFEVNSDSNLEFDLKKLDEPGQLLLRARAPEGDVFEADTGTIEATVRGSYADDRPDLYAEETVQFEVEKDYSGWDKFVDWFSKTGWKILLGLLLLAILLGYLFKRRFAGNVKRNPEIIGVPRMLGTTQIKANGKFKANRLPKFLPFVANTATLTYVPPGTPGFKKLKLKAGPSKKMIVTNWKDIAVKGNVEINGLRIDEETRKAPTFGTSAPITAITPQMTYEMTLN
jgi:hypothetical protein